MRQDKYPYPGCCELSVRINGEWITKSDSAGETDVEGIKGQSSDAFKRAAVKFRIGRYLYDLDSVWVDLVNGNIKRDSNRKPIVPKLPAWAIPLKYTAEQKVEFDRYLQTDNGLDLFIMLSNLPVGIQTALHNSFPKGEITKNKKLARALEAKGAADFKEYVVSIKLAIKEDDEMSLKQLGDEHWTLYQW